MYMIGDRDSLSADISPTYVGKNVFGIFSLFVRGQLVSNPEVLTSLAALAAGLKKSLQYCGMRESGELEGLDLPRIWYTLNISYYGDPIDIDRRAIMRGSEKFSVFTDHGACFDETAFFLVESKTCNLETLLWNAYAGSMEDVKYCSLPYGAYKAFVEEFLQHVKIYGICLE